MEPMTLGSPTHSPSGSPNTSFLPPFLMGEFNQPTSPRTNSLSPTKGRSLAFGHSPPVRPSPQHINQYSTPLRPKATPNVSFSNKVNGPPTQGLFDTLHQQDWNSHPQVQSPTQPFTSPQHHSSFHQQPQQENYYNQAESSYVANFSYSQNNRPNNNPSYNYGQSAQQHTSVLSNNESLGYTSPTKDPNTESRYEDESNEFWVTVFGFPQSASSMILTQFSNCGNILEKKFPPQGNWVWIKFASRTEARRAMGLNGRLMPGGLMIGVTSCNNPPQTSRGGARPLSAAPNRINTSTISTGNPVAVGATRSSGPLSRALEYVFGW